MILAIAAATFAFVVAAQTPASAPKEFDVASIKPNKSGDGRVMVQMTPGGRWAGTNVPIALLLQRAYDIRESQISGGPSWMRSERFDIEAKPDTSAGGGEPSQEDLSLMFQTLLAKRFHLTFHRETKEMPVLVLVTDKNGVKMKESEQAKDGGGGGGRGNNQIRALRGQIEGQGLTMPVLATSLSRMLGQMVSDETGLKGMYDFTLTWTPDSPPPGPHPSGEPAPPPPAVGGDGPTIFTAVREQLGLKLDSRKAPVQLFVIDRLERPEEN